MKKITPREKALNHFKKSVGFKITFDSDDGWVGTCKKAIDIALKEQAKEVHQEFKKIWSCLKFEKCSAKVIGYTFKKKDIDEFDKNLRERGNK